MKQRFLTVSRHVNTAVTIQYNEMHGTSCSYCASCCITGVMWKWWQLVVGPGVGNCAVVQLSS